MSAEAKLASLGVTLPPPARPAGVYTPLVLVGNTAWLSGHLPLDVDGAVRTGRVGGDLDQAAGYAAARQAALGLLSTLRSALGSLDRVRRVVKLTGFVASAAEFTAHPAVVNGASDLLAEVFGPAGIGARSAVGVAALPLGAAVEIEAIVEFEP